MKRSFLKWQTAVDRETVVKCYKYVEYHGIEFDSLPKIFSKTLDHGSNLILPHKIGSARELNTWNFQTGRDLGGHPLTLLF